MKRWLSAVALVLMVSGAALAQQPPMPPDGGDASAISPAELQRMFDAYALLQAQELLKIGDDKYATFLTRFKALQDARRRTLMERTRRVMELQRLGNDPQADEGTIRQRLTELKDVETRSAEELRKAYDAIGSHARESLGVVDLELDRHSQLPGVPSPGDRLADLQLRATCAATHSHWPPRRAQMSV